MTTTFLSALWLVAFFGGNPVTLQPTPSQPYALRQGYVDCQVVYYVPFAASNLALAKQLDQAVRKSGSSNGVEWTPGLDCALECVPTPPGFYQQCEERVGDVYMLNCGQCVVFSTQPGEDNYTPLWRVHYLEWRPRLPKVCLCSEGEILQALDDNKLMEIIPPSVLDATIVVPTSRIPSIQVAYINYSKKLVNFYCFKAFPPGPCKVKGNGLVSNQQCFLITDTNDWGLAMDVGANYAPKMALLSPFCCSCAAAFINPETPATPPSQLCQLPVLCEIPRCTSTVHNGAGGNWTDINKEYAPVLCWTLFDRSNAPISSVFSTILGINNAFFNGVIFEVPTVDPIVTNSPLSAASKPA